MYKAILVTADTELQTLADLIAISIRRGQGVRLQAGGATDVHLAVQAIAQAGIYLAYDGLEIGFVSGFVEAGKHIDAESAMYLHVDRPNRLFNSPPEDVMPVDCTDQPSDD